MSGQVIGCPGGSLTNSGGWLADQSKVAAGLRGERATAQVLDQLAALPNGPTVLHDLRIPIPGVSANIDHVVISGRSITVIDSKLWAPGFYWTLRGRTFRGLSRFTPAEKKTVPMAVSGLTRYLAKKRVSARFLHPLLVVWPSTASHLSLFLMASPGAHPIAGNTFARTAARTVGIESADPSIVAALRTLVITSR